MHVLPHERQSRASLWFGDWPCLYEAVRSLAIQIKSILATTIVYGMRPHHIECLFMLVLRGPNHFIGSSTSFRGSACYASCHWQRFSSGSGVRFVVRMRQARSLRIVFLPVPHFRWSAKSRRLPDTISSYVVYCHDFGLVSVPGH